MKITVSYRTTDGIKRSRDAHFDILDKASVQQAGKWLAPYDWAEHSYIPDTNDPPDLSLIWELAVDEVVYRARLKTRW